MQILTDASVAALLEKQKAFFGEGNTLPRAFRLALTESVLITLKNALGLLGIGVPEKM